MKEGIEIKCPFNPVNHCARIFQRHPQFTVDGAAMLARGEVPLGKVNQLLGQLEPGRFILLVTNFEPTPILEAMQKQNRRVFIKAAVEDKTQHLTFIG